MQPEAHVLRLQAAELADELAQLGRRLRLVAPLVVVVEAPGRAVEDVAHDGKVLVAQLGEERVRV